MSWDEAKKIIRNGGDTDTLVAALNDVEDIDLLPLHDKSLLHHAAVHNNTHAIRLLCSKGANTNIDNGRYKTPLFTAVSSGNAEAADALLDAGASTTYTYGMGRQITALHQAVISNQPRLVPLLVRKGIDPNTLSNFRETPIMNMFGNITRTSDIMTMGLWLILLGADINLSHCDIYNRNFVQSGEFTRQKEIAEHLVRTYDTIRAYTAGDTDSTVKSVCTKILAKESAEITATEFFHMTKQEGILGDMFRDIKNAGLARYISADIEAYAEGASLQQVNRSLRLHLNPEVAPLITAIPADIESVSTTVPVRNPLIGEKDKLSWILSSGVGSKILDFLGVKHTFPTSSDSTTRAAAESGPGSGYGGEEITASPGSSGSGAGQELPPSGAPDSVTPAAESGPRAYTGAGTAVAGPRPPAGSSGGATGIGR